MNSYSHISPSSTSADRINIAYFITPHGFGHASRAAAVMNAIYSIYPLTHFEIFTQVPKWFFESCLIGTFSYHSLLCDIGLVQNSPLEEDLESTLKHLDEFLPFDQLQVHELAGFVKNDRQCCIVLCDISPMGIAVAEAAGLPSFLVENFTWDWIYQGYLDQAEVFSKFIPILRAYFSSAEHRIQVEPVCIRSTDAKITAQPVSRKSLTPRAIIRDELNIPQSSPVILITMGGIQSKFDFLEQLLRLPKIYFIIPGSSKKMERKDNLALLPHHSKFFHPDLIGASDALVGKVGYSTVAEVYQAGIPYGCIPRPKFPESDVLVSYMMKNNPCLKITPEDFAGGSWIDLLPELLAMNPIKRNGSNGADQVAAYIAQFIIGQGYS